jgi:prepilin-type N-terminal cleavage/methylation domain-containing protein
MKAAPSPKRRSGFTLIELTVALAILVVASGLVIVRLSGWSSRQALHSSARTLGNTIRSWRERARAEETTYTLELEERSYRIRSGKEILRAGGLGAGESFTPGTGRLLILNSRGILPETRLTIQNAHGERVSIGLKALTNEIDYQEE